MFFLITEFSLSLSCVCVNQETAYTVCFYHVGSRDQTQIIRLGDRFELGRPLLSVHVL